MSSFTLTVDNAALQEGVQKVDNLRGVLTGEEVRAAMGGAIRLTLVNHFKQLESDAARHRTAISLGARQTGFYADAARGTQDPQVNAEGVSVTINKEGLLQRLRGGTLKPGPGKKWLTIPAIAEAYGKRAATFGNLRFVPLGPELAALKDKGTGSVWYWLKRQVTQIADPTVLPTEEELLAAAGKAGEETVTRLAARQQA